jgi:SAM-dependent methyltransferase
VPLCEIAHTRGAGSVPHVESPPDESSWSAFRDLDASGEAEDSLAWLQRVAGLAPVAAGKAASYEFLGLAPGRRVLDVGCGTGLDVRALAPRVAPGGEVVGVDSSASAVDTARRRSGELGQACRYEVADAARLPFADGTFDATRCDRTLQHVPDPQAAVAEMTRVTAPGGVVLVSEGRNELALGQELPELLELLEGFQPSAQRGNWLGPLVPLLLARAGVQDVVIHPIRGALTTGEAIALLYDLPRLARRAVASGVWEAGRYPAVRRRLDELAAAGQARVEMETVVFAGRAPGA